MLGPFFFLKRSWKGSVGLVLLICVFTILTQVGGIILWVSLPLLDTMHLTTRFRTWGLRILVFLILYLVSILLFIPLLAPLGGRIPLPWFATPDTPLRPANIGYCLLARNYVRPPVRQLLERMAVAVSHQYPGTTLTYLDANFPFFNRFPLLPHLSHHDGKKVDLAYCYRDATTKAPLQSLPSPIGYWAYEQPRPHEPQPCQGVQSWLRWDFQWLQPAFAFAELDPERTHWLLDALIEDAASQKIFIEPHLKTRLQITSSKVRFQGCSAARHDDHIHVQTY